MREDEPERSALSSGDRRRSPVVPRRVARGGRRAVRGRATIAEAGTFEEIAKLLDQSSDVDLVLLDLTMPGVRGFSGLMYLRAQYPSVPVVVVSANDDPAVIRRCMDFGASGFIPKTLGVDAMREAIATVLEGGIWTPPDVDLSRRSDAETAALLSRLATLTPQQVRVLMMLSEGLLNKQIAYELSSPRRPSRRMSRRSCRSSASRAAPRR